jgi:thiol:disulfide interchange protein
MKKTYFILLFTCLFVSLNAQEKDSGMHFEHNTTWQKILAKAKKEHKYIFVDCFTTWCGPCKIMTYNVFSKAEVGTFFNANFVNVEVQMDKTPKDNEEVTKWYANASAFETQYDVHNYPTYLIFNPMGEIVHRFVGSMPEDDFLAKGKDVVIPEKQYYTQVRKY